jgi:hypothetical protein
MVVVSAAADFLYATTALTISMAVLSVVPRPRWTRGTTWRANHPRR